MTALESKPKASRLVLLAVFLCSVGPAVLVFFQPDPRDRSISSPEPSSQAPLGFIDHGPASLAAREDLDPHFAAFKHRLTDVQASIHEFQKTNTEPIQDRIVRYQNQYVQVLTVVRENAVDSDVR